MRSHHERAFDDDDDDDQLLRMRLFEREETIVQVAEH